MSRLWEYFSARTSGLRTKHRAFLPRVSNPLSIRSTTQPFHRSNPTVIRRDLSDSFPAEVTRLYSFPRLGLRRLRVHIPAVVKTIINTTAFAPRRSENDIPFQNVKPLKSQEWLSASSTSRGGANSATAASMSTSIRRATLAAEVTEATRSAHRQRVGLAALELSMIPRNGRSVSVPSRTIRSRETLSRATYPRRNYDYKHIKWHRAVCRLR